MILNNLSMYDGIYLSYAVAKNPYVDMINKLKLLVMSYLDQPMKWEESEHALFLMNLVECLKMLSESKIFIFYPGGIFDVESILDLENKVDLEGASL